MFALQTRTTGKLPVKTFTSDDSTLLDHLTMVDTEILFSGCLDATHCVSCGSVYHRDDGLTATTMHKR